MKYPSFFYKWISLHCWKETMCYLLYWDSKDRVFQSDIIKEFFSCAALETTIRDEVQYEQRWQILTFSGILGTQCLPVSDLKTCRFDLCCECKESREYRKWSVKRRYSNNHCSRSLVARPVRAIRVTRGGLEPSAWANFPDKLDGWRHIRNRRGRLGTRLLLSNKRRTFIENNLISASL